MLTAQELAEKIAGSGPCLRRGAVWMVQCPAHEDSTPSLGITTGSVQPILMRCYAGCELSAVLAAAGLEMEDVCSNEYDLRVEKPIRESRVISVYRYRDENGEHLYDQLRLDPKSFAMRQPDSTGRDGWSYRLDGVRRVPYRLPELLAALARGEECWIGEGEKDVHYLFRQGVTATCNPGGAGKWTDELSELMHDGTFTVVADRDPSGQAHARAVRESLMRFGARARIVEAHPSCAKKGADSSDHFEAGYTLDDFIETCPYDGIEFDTTLTLDLDEYLGQPLPPRVFVIANTLARGEVLGVTGLEGSGKSTLLKQIAVCTAAGIHAFTLQEMEPSRVLFIDCENTVHDNQDDFRVLRNCARRAERWNETRERLYVLEPGPINLMDSETLAWFLERVQAHKPDLLVVGPIYNMVNRDISTEDNARQVKHAIDQARSIGQGCAVIWEHHVPKQFGANSRDTTPIGSSLLLRWPNFGFGMQPVEGKPTTYDWKPWRGPRRRQRQWPERLRVGVAGEWPWVEADPE